MLNQLRSDSLRLFEHTSRLHVFGKYSFAPRVSDISLVWTQVTYWWLVDYISRSVFKIFCYLSLHPWKLFFRLLDHSASQRHLTCGCFYLCHVVLLFLCHSLSLLPFPSIFSLQPLWLHTDMGGGGGGGGGGGAAGHKNPVMLGYMWHHLTWTVQSRCGHVKWNTKFDLLWVWPWRVIMSWFLCALRQMLVSSVACQTVYSLLTVFCWSKYRSICFNKIKK